MSSPYRDGAKLIAFRATEYGLGGVGRFHDVLP